MKLTLNNKSGESFSLDNNDIIVAIDETGQETFSDKNYPLFGLSACLILAGDYERIIHRPWNHLKKICGLSDHEVLHASKVNLKNFELINGLSLFFKNSNFGRIAVGCSTKTKFHLDISPIDLCVKILYDNLRKAFDIYKPSNIYVLIESSSRLNRDYKNYFMANKLFVSRNNVNTNIGLVNKSHAFPPIEVADFIAQAHGNQILRELKNNYKIRKDMESVFVNTNSIYSYNKHITEVG